MKTYDIFFENKMFNFTANLEKVRTTRPAPNGKILSQKELGRELANFISRRNIGDDKIVNWTEPTIASYEKGESYPSVEFLFAFSAFYNISLDDLIESNDFAVDDSNANSSRLYGLSPKAISTLENYASNPDTHDCKVDKQGNEHYYCYSSKCAIINEILCDYGFMKFLKSVRSTYFDILKQQKELSRELIDLMISGFCNECGKKMLNKLKNSDFSEYRDFYETSALTYKAMHCQEPGVAYFALDEELHTLLWDLDMEFSPKHEQILNTLEKSNRNSIEYRKALREIIKLEKKLEKKMKDNPSYVPYWDEHVSWY